jgi:hypothetical protein
MLLAKQPLSGPRVTDEKAEKIIPFCSAAATSAHGDDADPFHPIGCECWRVFRMQPHAQGPAHAVHQASVESVGKSRVKMFEQQQVGWPRWQLAATP